MPLPLEDHVRAVLLENDRGQRLYEALDDAWSEFINKYPERSSWQRKSASRNLFWECARTKLKQLAIDDKAVEAVEHRDTLSLVIEDEVLFRLKHANSSLMTRNVPTVEATEFDDHDCDLFGRAGLQRVRLCYVLNEFETKIIWIGIAAHDRGRFLWKIELTGRGAERAEPDLLDDLSPEPDTRRLIKTKSKPADDETAKGDKTG